MPCLRAPSRAGLSFGVGRDHRLLAEQEMTQSVCVEEPHCAKILILQDVRHAACSQRRLQRELWSWAATGASRFMGLGPLTPSLQFAWRLGTYTRSSCCVSLLLYLSSSPLPSPSAHFLSAFPPPLPDCPPPTAPPLPTVDRVYNQHTPGTHHRDNLALSQ